MPRRPRYAPAGGVFHVTNRGVERRRLFYKADDYQAFLRLLATGRERYAVSLFAVCLMPNHFHLVVQADFDRELSAYLQWVQGCYACDLRANTGTVGHGHVFQQRFWSDVITDELHFLNVVRYIERNPIESSLVARAESWQWSSLFVRRGEDSWLNPLPVRLPSNWLDLVNQLAEYEESF
jgi:putative transposase